VRYLLLLTLAITLPAADLSTKKALNLAVIKQLVAAGEAEAAKIGVGGRGGQSAVFLRSR